jgi:hypothetical protein
MKWATHKDHFFLKVFERIGRQTIEPRIQRSTARWDTSPTQEPPILFGRYELAKASYTWLDNKEAIFAEKAHDKFGPTVMNTLEKLCPVNTRPISLSSEYKHIPSYLWSILFPKMRVIRLEDEGGWTDAYLKMDGKVRVDPQVVKDIFHAYATVQDQKPVRQRVAAPAAS